MNLSQIKSDALAATQGEWSESKFRAGNAIVDKTGLTIVAVYLLGKNRPKAETKANARHIANMDPPTTIALIGRLERLEKAAQNFIDKVDRGEARSVRSYAEFKEALGGEREPTAEERIRMKDERIAELEAKLAARQALGEDNES